MISSLHIQRITVLVSHWTGVQLVLNLISVGGCHWSKYSTFTLSDAWPAWPTLDWRERDWSWPDTRVSISGLDTLLSEHYSCFT